MSTDLDDLMRRDDELYDMTSSSDATVKADAPKGMADRMAVLASSPEGDADISTVDP